MPPNPSSLTRSGFNSSQYSYSLGAHRDKQRRVCELTGKNQDQPPQKEQKQVLQFSYRPWAQYITE